jgi:putative endonuclease
MKTVYILQSTNNPDRHYTGITDDVNQRLLDHNDGKCPHTSKYTPWKLILNMSFDDEGKARAFERYLKSGSGRAFAKRHF